tara:strand:+ start:495 stop:956 length:462 start_codon:yes stop_codon:yes gene_type:complete
MQARNTQVMFYQLPEDDNGANSLFLHACLQAAFFYRQKQKVFIYSQDQEKAHDIDEMLWAFDANSFVPHNLKGEGPSYGAPVEISWQAPTGRRPILINLTDTVPDFVGQFSQVIDFVPNDETLKQLARERFKAYRQLGFTLGNQILPQVIPIQ